MRTHAPILHGRWRKSTARVAACRTVGGMTPWEVIEEALVRRRPVRNLQWLADQIGVTIQVVHNWKVRGVPAKRYRDVASALDLTVDQVEGIARLPWEDEPKQTGPGLWPEVAAIASEINLLPPEEREHLIGIIRAAMPSKPKNSDAARTRLTQPDDSVSARKEPARKAAR